MNPETEKRLHPVSHRGVVIILPKSRRYILCLQQGERTTLRVTYRGLRISRMIATSTDYEPGSDGCIKVRSRRRKKMNLFTVSKLRFNYCRSPNETIFCERIRDIRVLALKTNLDPIDGDEVLAVEIFTGNKWIHKHNLHHAGNIRNKVVYRTVT